MNTSRDGEPWTPEEDALLGTAADRVIAAQLGRSSVAVGNRRTKLGIQRKALKAPSGGVVLSPQIAQAMKE